MVESPKEPPKGDFSSSDATTIDINEPIDVNMPVDTTNIFYDYDESAEIDQICQCDPTSDEERWLQSETETVKNDPSDSWQSSNSWVIFRIARIFREFQMGNQISNFTELIYREILLEILIKSLL